MNSAELTTKASLISFLKNADIKYEEIVKKRQQHVLSY